MAFTKVAPAGIGSTPGDGYRIGDSFLHSTGVEITNINATGIVTAASLDISGSIDVDGHTNLDNVSIAGVTTITGSGNALEIVGGVVRNRGTTSARFVANNGSAEGYFGWSSGVLTVGQASATLSLEATGSNHIQLKTGGSEKLRIDNNGKLILSNSEGIQLSAKNSNLYLVDGAISYYGTTNAVYVNGAGVAGWLRLNAAGSTNNRTAINIYGHNYGGGDSIDFRTNSLERLRIDSDGFIRYATSNMQIFADSSDGSDDHYLNLSGGGACSQTRGAQVVMYGNEKSNEQGRLLLMAGNSGNTNGSIDFYTGGGKKATILSDGKIGINQSVPTCQLQVDAGSSGAGTVTALELNHKGNDTNDAVKLNFARAGSDIGSIVLEKVASNNTTDFIFNTRSFNTVSESMRITGAGDVSIGGRDTALANYAAGSTTTQLAVVKDGGAAGSGYHEVAHFTGGTDSDNTGAIVRITQFNNDRGLFVKSGRGSGNNAIMHLGLRDSNATDIQLLTLHQSGEILTNNLSSASFNNSNGKIFEITGNGSAGSFGVVSISGNHNSDGGEIGYVQFINRENSNSASGNANSRCVALLDARVKTSDNNAGDDSGGYLRFITKNEGEGLAERFRLTARGSFKSHGRHNLGGIREITSGTLANGESVSWNGSGTTYTNGALNWNSIGGNAGGWIGCLSVTAADQNPAGAFILTGVHGAGFNTFNMLVNAFDSGISVTPTGTGASSSYWNAVISNTSGDTIYYRMLVMHLGTATETIHGL